MKQIKFNGHDNFKVSALVWDDVKEPVGLILIAHDLKENSRYYNDLAEFLNKHNYVVSVMEFRLHGKLLEENQNLPESKDYFKDVVNDLFIYSKIMQSTYNVPLAVLGHGFGAYIVLRFLEICDMAKLAIISGYGYSSSVTLKLISPLSTAWQVISTKNKLSKEIDKLIRYPYEVKFFDSNYISTNEDFYRDFVTDPMYKTLLPAQYYHSFLINSVYPDKNLGNISQNTKLLLVSGENDPVGKKGKTINRLFNKLDKLGYHVTLQLFENMLHNIYNEINSEQVFEFILEYLQQFL